MLVVVVVGDGDSDGAGLRGSLHGIERDGAAEGGEKDDFAASGFDGVDDVGGDGQVHGGAGGWFSAFGLDVRDFGVGQALFARGWGFGDEVALRADVVDDALLLGFGVDAYDEAEVEVGSGSGGNGVGGVGSGLAGGDAVDVERGFVEEFEEMFASAVGVAEDEFVAEHLVVDRGFGEGLLFDGAEGDDAVVEVRDENVAVGVLHAGEELDEHQGGVGGPVAVVATVEGVVGAVDGDLEVGVAACAEDEGLAAGLVDGAIADQPDVATDKVAVGHEDLFEVGGASFFFAFPHEADVGLERNVSGLESAEGGELGEDGGFVVAGSAGVDARFAVDLFDDGGEGLAGVPLGWGDGLAVVVCVEDDGAFGAGSFDLSPDDGRRGGGETGGGEEFGFGSALLELGDEEFGVFAETGGIGGDVGDGEEFCELMD